MTASEQTEIVPAAAAYEPPHLETLGQLTDLATGHGEDGLLIVMAS